MLCANFGIAVSFLYISLFSPLLVIIYRPCNFSLFVSLSSPGNTRSLWISSPLFLPSRYTSPHRSFICIHNTYMYELSFQSQCQSFPFSFSRFVVCSSLLPTVSYCKTNSSKLSKIEIYICIYLYIYIYTYIYTNVLPNIWYGKIVTHIQSLLQVIIVITQYSNLPNNVCMYIYIYIDIYISMYVYIYIDICLYTYCILVFSPFFCLFCSIKS